MIQCECQVCGACPVAVPVTMMVCGPCRSGLHEFVTVHDPSEFSVRVEHVPVSDGGAA